MRKYEIADEENDETRIEMRFRSKELNAIVDELTQVYPGFKQWVEMPNNRYFFREIVNVAINRYADQLWNTEK